MRHSCFSCCALLISLTVLAVAQADPTDEFIRAEMRRQNIPGLSLVVLRHGEVIKAEGYGLANIKLKTPATPHTVYKIASVSKQFIAAGIMVLVQQRRLGLSDSVRKHLAEAPPAWSGITIRHLLTHTSGLVREAPGFNPLKSQSDAEVIRTAYPVPLRFAPGDKWEYSNAGYFVLAEVIRIVTGRPWPAHLREAVFGPSGMHSTWPTNTTEPVPNRAQGYVDNSVLRDAPEWLALRPSGAFLSTAMDLARWDATLYTDKVLTAASRQQMWTPVTLNDGNFYPSGFGWMLAEVNGHRLVHHPGGMPGTRADVARFVDDGLTVIVIMNLDDVDIAAIVRGVASRYLPTRVQDAA